MIYGTRQRLGFAHKVCLDLQTFSGIAQMKRNHTTFPQTQGLTIRVPLLLWGAKPAQGVSGHAGWYLTRQAFPFRSSYKVYFVKPYSMNVHLVKRRYK